MIANLICSWPDESPMVSPPPETSVIPDITDVRCFDSCDCVTPETVSHYPRVSRPLFGSCLRLDKVTNYRVWTVYFAIFNRRENY